MPYIYVIIALLTLTRKNAPVIEWQINIILFHITIEKMQQIAPDIEIKNHITPYASLTLCRNIM